MSGEAWVRSDRLGMLHVNRSRVCDLTCLGPGAPFLNGAQFVAIDDHELAAANSGIAAELFTAGRKRRGEADRGLSSAR